jgi:hypothetical protein
MLPDFKESLGVAEQRLIAAETHQTTCVADYVTGCRGSACSRVRYSVMTFAYQIMEKAHASLNVLLPVL